MKRIISITLALIMMISLCACGHQHTWVEATCTEPKTCSKCGETEGEPLGHDWKSATCTEPETCKICGETEGKPLGHAWVEATYTKPKTCSRCKVEEGEPLTLSEQDREAYVGKWEAFLIYSTKNEKSYTPKKLGTSFSVELNEDMTAKINVSGKEDETTWMPVEDFSVRMVRVEGFENLAVVGENSLIMLTSMFQGLQLSKSDLPCLQGGDAKTRIFYHRVK